MCYNIFSEAASTDVVKSLLVYRVRNAVALIFYAEKGAIT